MRLGSSLSQARRKSGLSQEAVTEKLGVSRQTISKWEVNETLPDIREAKTLAGLYHLPLDELVNFDVELEEIQRVITHTSEEKQKEIDWTKVWGQKYPVLTTYQQQVDTAPYTAGLQAMLDRLRMEQGYSDLDAFLVLKDILGQIWSRHEKG